METSSATDIMSRFAERTGVAAAAPQQRYLWTDAFAVCNLLGLHASGEDPDGQSTALALIEAVHQTLGQHRADDVRRGWISGLPAEEGEAHPTAAGLRIGKPLPERAADVNADPRSEWDQDGQYFHYLTRWMHALDQTAWSTGDVTYNRWARELAAAAFRAFSYLPSPGAPRRMYWKMSIDLSRPLVPAMGHHDPLDGYIACLQLRSSAQRLTPGAGTDLAPTLSDETRELAAMVAGGDWATDDPLGLGGLMSDAFRVFQFERRGTAAPAGLLPALLSDISAGLGQLLQQNPWQMPADRRLPFRELGLAIGLRALEQLQTQVSMSEGRNLPDLLAPLADQYPLADRLAAFWLEARNRQAATWIDHENINAVMVATALAPAGYIQLGQ